MYKIIGSDGKEYGPITIEDLRQWIREGRINRQTRVQEAGATEWKLAADFPELGFGSPAGSPPAISPAVPSGEQQSGLAITSFVLGLLSMVCFGLLTGIPAIICGHIARGRARRFPAQYGGAGFALTGLILGYVSVVVTLLILPAMLLPALSRAKGQAQRVSCVNNMKQIGLAARVWSTDHDGAYSWNVSTNKGGTLELALPGSNGYDRNAFLHFRALASELNTPKILVCPADAGRQAAFNFETLQASNVSYGIRTGAAISETNPQEVLAICPIHNNVLYCDGHVEAGRKVSR